MMWMMMLCCALPLVFLLFAGSSVFAGGYLKYVIIGGLAVACIAMMFMGHGRHGGTDGDEKAGEGGESKTKDEHKKGSCCH